jgi:adenosylcobyric acid synthase
MLGEHLADPQGVETGGAAAGLGLLPVSTTFAAPKTTARVRARVLGHGPLAAAAGAEVRGYELHAGVTLTRGDDAALRLIERSGAPAHALDGAIAGTVIGTYVHGLLTCAPLRRALLVEAARRRGTGADPRWGVSDVVDRYERLADLVASALDLETLGRLARCPLSAVAPA